MAGSGRAVISEPYQSFALTAVVSVNDPCNDIPHRSKLIHEANNLRAYKRFPLTSQVTQTKLAPLWGSLMEPPMLSKTLLLSLLPLAMSVMAGVLIPAQAASGGTLGRMLGSPLWGAAVALLIGFAALVITALAIRLPSPNFASAFQGPWWIWIGGITGAIYVATSLTLLPKVGAANFILCVIAGQMVAALVLDHFGLLGLAVKPVNIDRVLGVLIMLAGLAVAQYSSVQAPPHVYVSSDIGRTESHPGAPAQLRHEGL